MYSKKQPVEQKNTSASNKNPNRVAGGLRAQGVDHFEMLGEDGSIQKIPTQKYVESLEEQIRKQRAAITVMERKIARLERDVSSNLRFKE